jgi:hypothetical protein
VVITTIFVVTPTIFVVNCAQEKRTLIKNPKYEHSLMFQSKRVHFIASWAQRTEVSTDDNFQFPSFLVFLYRDSTQCNGVCELFLLLFDSDVCGQLLFRFLCCERVVRGVAAESFPGMTGRPH